MIEQSNAKNIMAHLIGDEESAAYALPSYLVGFVGEGDLLVADVDGAYSLVEAAELVEEETDAIGAIVDKVNLARYGKETTGENDAEAKRLKARALEAATRFLERKGLEIVETSFHDPLLGGTLDIVAGDGDGYVFVDVTATKEVTEGFVEKSMERSMFEGLAARWLGERGAAQDVPIRFDRIALVVCGDDRALLRHHVNALNEQVD